MQAHLGGMAGAVPGHRSKARVTESHKGSDFPAHVKFIL